jgi:hypothetical protein
LRARHRHHLKWSRNFGRSGIAWTTTGSSAGSSSRTIDFKQATGAIRSDDEVPTGASDDAKRVAESVQDVLVQHAVLTRAVRDLHTDK